MPRREKIEKPAQVIDPYSVTVIGTQPLVQVIVESHDQVLILRLPTDLQTILHRKLGLKLPGGQHD